MSHPQVDGLLPQLRVLSPESTVTHWCCHSSSIGARLWPALVLPLIQLPSASHYWRCSFEEQATWRYSSSGARTWETQSLLVCVLLVISFFSLLYWPTLSIAVLLIFFSFLRNCFLLKNTRDFVQVSYELAGRNANQVQHLLGVSKCWSIPWSPNCSSVRFTRESYFQMQTGF